MLSFVVPFARCQQSFKPRSQALSWLMAGPANPACPTPAPPDSGSAADSMHLVRSGAGMQTGLGRSTAASEPFC